MTDPQYDELIEPTTETEIAESMLALSEDEGLPVTSWHDGSVWRVLQAIVPSLVADAYQAVARIARGVLLGLSRGDWLTLYGRSQYDEPRAGASPTAGQMVLEDHGGGPHTVTADAHTIADSTGRYVYRVMSGGTLALNGTLTVDVVATAVGAAYNLPNDTDLQLLTVLSTVTVTNPADPSTGTWITQLGADVESDDTYTERLPLKWATLATGSPPDAYRAWALAIAGVTRAKCDDANPDGPNTVRVYIDSSALVATLQAELDEKAPSGTAATAVAATTETVTIEGVATVRRAYRTAAEAAVDAALAEYELAVDIGGIVRKAEVIERVMTPEGMVDFELATSWAGSPNIQLGATAIPDFSTSITWVEV